MEWLSNIANDYGLFVALVAFVIWDSRQRERRLLAIIDTLGEEIKSRLIKLEQKLWGGKDQ